MATKKQVQEVAHFVEESLQSVPAFDNMTLTVDTNGITSSQVDGKTWWRVPIVPHPYPRRLSAFYEALAEVEGHLQEERGLDILLHSGPVTEEAMAHAGKNGR